RNVTGVQTCALPILVTNCTTATSMATTVIAITLEHLIMAVVAVTVVIQAVAATPHPIPITVVAILVAVVPLVTNQRSVLNRLLRSEEGQVGKEVGII